MTASKEFDIYHRQRRKDRIQKKLEESSICQENKELILKFNRHRTLSKNIGVSRTNKHTAYLIAFAEALDKPFTEATREDIECLVEWIHNKKGKWGGRKKTGISEWSKHDYLLLLKMFYRWLRKKENPKETAWIGIKQPKSKRLTPDEILTWDEVVHLSQAAMNPRDQALPQVLWDSGFRIDELLSMTLQDVEYLNSGSALKLHIRRSKTEQRAPVVVRSAPALINWVRSHPLRGNPSAPLWVKVYKKDQPMDYAAARKVLRDLARRSKFTKNVNPHSFRKSSASFYSHHLTPSELKARYGWIQSSKMLDVYCFPDQDEVNKKIMRMHGLATSEEEKAAEEEKPRECFFCKTLNPAGQQICVNKDCGRSLNPDAYLKGQDFIENVDRRDNNLEATVKQLMDEMKALREEVKRGKM